MSSRSKRSLLDFLPKPSRKDPKKLALKAKKPNAEERDSEQKQGEEIEVEKKLSAVEDNEMYKVQNLSIASVVNNEEETESEKNVHRQHEMDNVFLKALEGERNRTKGASTIEIKEISQDALREGVGGVQREADPLALALTVESEEGTDANDALSEPSYQVTKEAFKKHQIGTLYQNMKKNEMKLLRKDAQNAKMKRETERKYGWR